MSGARGGAAVAIFVKTPGRSPVKTRLARDIGRARADEFYRHAVAAVAEVAAGLRGVRPYWAVAEHEAVTAVGGWEEAPAAGAQFPTVVQGEGDLAARLNRVYRELNARYRVVLLIGADSPQITTDLLERAAAHLDRADTEWLLGRCPDGGFYVFGGNAPVGEEIWRAVTYSAASTARELASLLADRGRISEWPMLSDVDEAADLAQLARELDGLSAPTARQQALREWLRGVGSPPAGG